MKINKGPTFQMLLDCTRDECETEFLVTGILIPRMWGIFENRIATMDVNQMITDDKDAFSDVLLQMRTKKMLYVFTSESRILFGENKIKEALKKDGAGISYHQESIDCLIMNSFDGEETNLHVNIIKNDYLTNWQSYDDEVIYGRFGDM